jgi:hypothetical protein
MECQEREGYEMSHIYSIFGATLFVDEDPCQ